MHSPCCSVLRWRWIELLDDDRPGHRGVPAAEVRIAPGWRVPEGNVEGLARFEEQDAQMQRVFADEVRGRAHGGGRVERHALRLWPGQDEPNDVTGADGDFRRFERVLVAALDETHQVDSAIGGPPDPLEQDGRRCFGGLGRRGVRTAPQDERQKKDGPYDRGLQLDSRLRT